MKKCLGKKSFAIGIIFFFAGASVIPSTGTNIRIEKPSIVLNSGNILYVGGSGPNNYTTIQNAIDNASDDDTVFVYSGIYDDYYITNEACVRIKKCINLVGEDKNSTIIDGRSIGKVIWTDPSAGGVTISGFTIQNSGNNEYDAGIWLSSPNSFISGNKIISNRMGIGLWGGYSTIKDNIISNNGDGIRLSSGDNTIESNSFFYDGIIYSHYVYLQNKVQNNTVNAKSLVYFDSESDKIIDYEIGQVILVKCNNLIIKNLVISDTDVGIQLMKCDDCIISNITCSNNNEGISIRYCNRTTVTGNNIKNNFNPGLDSFHTGGIYLDGSSGCNISENTISSNNGFGLRIICSNGNIIKSNAITLNEKSICLDYSRFNIVIKNNFIGNNRQSSYFKYSFSSGDKIYKIVLNNVNLWMLNYWNRPRLLPKLLPGVMHIGFGYAGSVSIPWINFDWRPALKPYDI